MVSKKTGFQKIVPFPQGCHITTKTVGQDVLLEDASLSGHDLESYNGHNLLSHKGEKVAAFSDNGGDTYVEVRKSDEDAIGKLNAALKEGECLIRSKKIQ